MGNWTIHSQDHSFPGMNTEQSTPGLLVPGLFIPCSAVVNSRLVLSCFSDGDYGLGGDRNS